MQKAASDLLKIAAFFVILFYRTVVRGLLGAGGFCRFYPSCGDYALQAYGQNSFLRATGLVLRRLLICHPFGGFFRFAARRGAVGPFRRRKIPRKTLNP